MLRETRALPEAVVLHTNGMFDHDSLCEGISSKVPSDSDRELFRELMEIHRKEGKQRLEERIQELIDGVGSETHSCRLEASPDGSLQAMMANHVVPVVVRDPSFE